MLLHWKLLGVSRSLYWTQHYWKYQTKRPMEILEGISVSISTSTRFAIIIKKLAESKVLAVYSV